MVLQSDGLLTMVLLWRPHEEGRNECTQSSPVMEVERVWCSGGGRTVVIRDSRVPERVGQGTGGVNALPHAEQGPSCLVPTLECSVGVQCSKGVLHVPPGTVACAGDRCSSICARGAA